MTKPGQDARVESDRTTCADDRARPGPSRNLSSGSATTSPEGPTRQLLASSRTFEDRGLQVRAPSTLVEAEFNNIWTQVTRDLDQAGRSFEDEDTTEDEARTEYQRLAERRVRLGLVLAEIGDKAGVQVTDDEMQRALVETIRRYPQNQQQQVYEHFRSNPSALANIRAPLFEEKVVDHLMNEVKVTDQKVTREELMADDEDEAETRAEAADEKKAAKKKAPAKKKTAKADEAEGTAEA